jgi:hypothetical protein
MDLREDGTDNDELEIQEKSQDHEGSEEEKKNSVGEKPKPKKRRWTPEERDTVFQAISDWPSLTQDDVVEMLRECMPTKFGPLRSNTVTNWRNRAPKQEAKRAAKEAKANEKAKRRKRPRGPVPEGPVPDPMTLARSLASSYKKIRVAELAEAIDVVHSLAKHGVGTTVPLTTGVLLGVLQEAGSDWSPSTSWVRNFLYNIGCAPRAGTREAGKLPGDFEDIKELFLTGSPSWSTCTRSLLVLCSISMRQGCLTDPSRIAPGISEVPRVFRWLHWMKSGNVQSHLSLPLMELYVLRFR